jgi:hypothetical protein
MLDNQQVTVKNDSTLPQYFRPLLWSYDFSAIDLQKHRKTIVINTINYGDLKHWRWIAQFYGKEEIRKTLVSISATEIRQRVRRLASLIFNVDTFNYAPRGVR